MRRNGGSHRVMNSDITAIEWMKTHTIEDLKTMATQMERQGEDSRGVWCLIDDLNVMSCA